MNICADIRVARRVNPTVFGETLTFHVAPVSHHCNDSNTLIFDQIPSELMAFPLA